MFSYSIFKIDLLCGMSILGHSKHFWLESIPFSSTWHNITSLSLIAGLIFNAWKVSSYSISADFCPLFHGHWLIWAIQAHAVGGLSGIVAGWCWFPRKKTLRQKLAQQAAPLSAGWSPSPNVTHGNSIAWCPAISPSPYGGRVPRFRSFLSFLVWFSFSTAPRSSAVQCVRP